MIGKYADTIKLRKELTPFIDKYGHISCSITKFNILLERSNADAEEVKRGRWIKITNDWVDDAQYVCSCCGRLLTVSNRLTEFVSMSYPYCHCGAKMVNEDE